MESNEFEDVNLSQSTSPKERNVDIETGEEVIITTDAPSQHVQKQQGKKNFVLVTVAFVAVVMVAIALIIGLSVGLTQTTRSSSSSSSSSNGLPRPVIIDTDYGEQKNIASFLVYH